MKNASVEFIMSNLDLKLGSLKYVVELLAVRQPPWKLAVGTPFPKCSSLQNIHKNALLLMLLTKLVS